MYISTYLISTAGEACLPILQESGSFISNHISSAISTKKLCHVIIFLGNFFINDNELEYPKSHFSLFLLYNYPKLTNFIYFILKS